MESELQPIEAEQPADESFEYDERSNTFAEPPSFKANGESPFRMTMETEANPLIRAQAPNIGPNEDEADAVANLHLRALTREELTKAQAFIARRKDAHQEWIDKMQGEIRHAAYNNTIEKNALLKRKRDLDKRERNLALTDKKLAEKQHILDERDKLMEDMPAKMDDVATRKWLADIRPMMLATWLSIAQNSSSEQMRARALTRLSDEDRGQHGKDLKEDEDSGPGYFIVEKGSFGIPE